jgi:hypothetical protein
MPELLKNNNTFVAHYTCSEVLFFRPLKSADRLLILAGPGALCGLELQHLRESEGLILHSFSKFIKALVVLLIKARITFLSHDYVLLKG